MSKAEEILKKVWYFLEGKKTYLIAAFMVILTYLVQNGYLDADKYDLVYNILVALGLVTLRSGMGKR